MPDVKMREQIARREDERHEIEEPHSRARNCRTQDD